MDNRTMLMITRRPGETLLVGETVSITVVQIRNNQVRLEVRAPREIRIDREEKRMMDGLEAAMGVERAPRVESVGPRRRE
jgi:carbon storage regulator